MQGPVKHAELQLGIEYRCPEGRNSAKRLSTSVSCTEKKGPRYVPTQVPDCVCNLSERGPVPYLRLASGGATARDCVCRQLKARRSKDSSGGWKVTGGFNGDDGDPGHPAEVGTDPKTRSTLQSIDFLTS